jgi:hypothetical protein
MNKRLVVVIAILFVGTAVLFFYVGRASIPTSTAPYVYGNDPVKDSGPATPSTADEKKQCSEDGAAWYQKNIQSQSTPQAIAASNAEPGIQSNTFVTGIYSGSVEYVYSTKLNTCLADYAETISYRDGGTFTDHTITDVYTNKNVADWSWAQEPVETTQDAIKKSDATSFNQAEYELIQQQN